MEHSSDVINQKRLSLFDMLSDTKEFDSTYWSLFMCQMLLFNDSTMHGQAREFI